MKKKNASVTTTELTPRQHVARLIEWMGAELYEKDQIIAMSLLSAVAGENVFLLGPPGTAKSMVAARLKSVFRGARSFDYLMSRFSTPDEIFGPVSISRLKSDDRYERLTEGYLPEADVVFLDEIWKAGPSIQNTLLTVINEHIFYNGGRAVKTPMKVLIAASNELPPADEGLEALWDRFLVRMVSNCIVSERNFFKMLSGERKKVTRLDESLLIDDELYRSWQKQAADVRCSQQVMAAIKSLRRTLSRLEKADNDRMRFYVSDRRWRKAYRLMQTSAFLNDRQEIDLSDFCLLIHSFWNDVEAIPPLTEAFTEAITEPLADTLASIERNIRISMKPASSSDIKPHEARSEKKTSKEFAEFDYFYYMVENHPDGELYFSKWDYATLTDTPRDGVKYFDTKRNRFFVRALLPGTSFDAASQNAVNVINVRLSRCRGGLIIDRIPYFFVTDSPVQSEAPATTDLAAIPVYRRVAILKQTLADAVADWNRTVELTWKSAPNLFLSPADRALVDKALSEASKLIKTTEVKLKNLDSML